MDNPQFLESKSHRNEYLNTRKQVEKQSLEQLYGNSAEDKDLLTFESSPQVLSFMNEFKKRRQDFQHSANHPHSSVIQEVEQERELAYAVENVREVQKQPYYKAFVFPGLHADITNVANTGGLVADSEAFPKAFLSLQKTDIGTKFGITSDHTENKLYVSTEFTKTVNVPPRKSCDHLLVRPFRILTYLELANRFF